MRHRLLLLAPLAALAFAACGSASTAEPGTARPATGKGWIGGEPDFSSAAAEGSVGFGAAAPAGRAESAVDAAATTTVAGTREGPLQAGSVDDNADYAGYLAYLARYRSLGLPSRDIDASGRVVVTVTGANGLPVLGATVTVDGVAALRTGADGRVIFLPATYGAVQPSYHLTLDDGTSADVTPGTDVALTSTANGGAVDGVPVDVVFLLDVTGSMGDEIDQLKDTVGQVAQQLHDLPQHPDIRFGMTLFRDEGDAFVTSTFDLTGDLQSFEGALAHVVADGGGDTPEAVDEAFAASLSEPSWRDPASTAQFVFLVGDAAPHVERQLEQPYPATIKLAQSRGITVHAIAASSTDDTAEHAFRAIAEGTGGRFVFLAYGAGGAAVGEHTDIAPTDYEQMSLDALVVRLVGESLARLTGTPIVTPVTTSVPRPNGQTQPTS